MKVLLKMVLLICLSYQVNAQDNSWQVLASKDVSYKSEKDNIKLRGIEKDVTKLKIKCTQGSLKIRLVSIVYNDGTINSKKPKGTGLLTKDMSSFAFIIDKKKTPERIELEYEALGNMLLTKRAKIELLGFK